MSRQRSTMLVTAGAVLLGLAIVGFAASQQLGVAPAASSAPSLAVVVVSASPAPPTTAAGGTSAGGTSAGALASAPAGPSAQGSDGPAASGIALYQPGPDNSTPASIPSRGRTLGDPTAAVTIDLYGDFRCSACYAFTEGGTAAAINAQLIAPGKAKLVWHDYTVIDLRDQTHASRDAANAAWCAADQDKFWVMHDWLYVNQSPTESPDAFTTERLLAIGKVAGLDMATFTPCVVGGAHDAEIAKEESSLPAAVAAHGTPSVLVKGTLVDASLESVKAAVAAAR